MLWVLGESYFQLLRTRPTPKDVQGKQKACDFVCMSVDFVVAKEEWEGGWERGRVAEGLI